MCAKSLDGLGLPHGKEMEEILAEFDQATKLQEALCQHLFPLATPDIELCKKAEIEFQVSLMLKPGGKAVWEMLQFIQTILGLLMKML